MNISLKRLVPETDVQIWWSPIRHVEPYDLPHTERTRWQLLRRQEDRDRLATGIWLRGHALRELTGLDDAPVRRWCYGCDSKSHGGVQPTGNWGNLWNLSLAHAGNTVVLAASKQSAGLQVLTGIDVESTSRMHPSLARFFLSKPELERLESGRILDVSTWLIRTWTAKEAVLKAAGCGLHVPMTTLDAGVPPGPGKVKILGHSPMLSKLRGGTDVLVDLRDRLPLGPELQASLYLHGAIIDTLTVHRTCSD